MDVTISYRHLEPSPSVDEKINQKLERLKKFFHGNFHIDWTCSVDKDVHQSDVLVKGDHFSFHATASMDNLYKTIDEAVEKIERQLQKKNSMQKDKIHRS